jgi:chromobox protein 1
MNIHSESASEILNDYLEQIGGRDALMAAWEEKKQAAKKGKKRGRSSTEANGTNGAKRGRKAHSASGTPPASVKNAEFKPPSGSWEDQVVNIDACEGAEGSVVVYLTWRGGHKTQHPLFQVYKRCPQRVSKLLLR